jgi:acyl-coenzyme A thioesterase PaaI-like protein
MDITDIPFNRYLQISHPLDQPNSLDLAFAEHLNNHIGTFHASAQFALAEACSGLALQDRFADLAASALPVLRASSTKFKKPASTTLRATANLSEEAARTFQHRFTRKGRATICIPVDVMDSAGTLTMSGTFDWFVTRI